MSTKKTKSKNKKSRNDSDDSNLLFNSFDEYWHYVKYLTENQRDILFNSLSTKQQQKIKKSYQHGGWHDLIMRDELDAIADNIQEKYGVNLIELRCRALRGKSVYVSLDFWYDINTMLQKYQESHKYYLIGEIEAVVCKENQNVVLLVKEDSGIED